MKQLFIIFSSLALVSFAFGQAGGSAPSGNSNGTGAGDGTATPIRTGKVEVPPEKSRPVVIAKTAKMPIIDGRIDDDVWKQASVFKDFYQVYPGDNIAPSKPTEVYILYDEKNLYVAFKCWDDRDKIRATVAKRDNVFGEDNVRMWLDTYNDQRRAYVLGFNPLGIQQDGILTEGSGADFSVDIVMESKGVIEDWGWSVEAMIPFKSLRYTAGKGKLWGFNIARNIDRFNDESDQWLPNDRNVSGFLIQHGKITGLDDVKYERTLELVPSVTVSETGRKMRTIPRHMVTPTSIDPGRFVNQPIKADFGLTMKYTITPSITLDAAINPDFAEIEADAPVITANQRFPIFYEEKRPFFLEGVDIFRSPFQVFYSRTIVDPDVAVKLTGKTGKTSFGILAATDKAPGNYSDEELADPQIRPRIEEFNGKNATFAVVRLKRDFGSEHNIGFFGTYRSFPEQKNILASVDGRFKLNSKMVTQFQLIGSTSKRCFFDPEFEPTLNPGQAAVNSATCGGGTYNGVTVQGSPFNQYRTGNGLGYYANLDYTTERHGWFLEASGRTRYYRADAGFTRRTDTHNIFFFNRFSSKSKPDAKIIRTQWNQMGGYNYDGKGRLQGWNAQSEVSFNLQKQTYVRFEAGTGREKLYEEEFGVKRSPTRPYGTFLGEPFRSVSQQWVSGNINQTLNKHFNYGLFVGGIRNAFDFFYFEYSPAANAVLQNPGPATQFDAEIYAEVKPIDPFRASISYSKRRLVRNDNRSIRLDSDLVTIRSTYQFSRFVFTRFRLDYDDQSNGFSGQALFGWNPSPGTAFYVGYNDAFKYNGLSDFTGHYEPGFNRSSRTFFIRASYLFRKSF
ncbi:MAG: carbohydrate binding family 9 domain-containing protein [Chloracidobacterium sp.]|nr:carbohydrate binding family 9 domain-containing protein [Chloracidobacterium sp.]